MFKVEFDTKIDSGTIKIPEKYIKNLGSRVKVIILTSEADETKFFREFKSLKLKTKGLKFNREMANER